MLCQTSTRTVHKPQYVQFYVDLEQLAGPTAPCAAGHGVRHPVLAWMKDPGLEAAHPAAMQLRRVSCKGELSKAHQQYFNFSSPDAGFPLSQHGCFLKKACLQTQALTFLADNSRASPAATEWKHKNATSPLFAIHADHSSQSAF